MSTTASHPVGSKLGMSCAAIALAVGCALSSAASAQVSAATSSTIPSQTGSSVFQSRPLIVFVDHRAVETATYATNTGTALAGAHVRLGKNDIVVPALHAALPLDGIVHVERVITWTQTICSRIAPLSVVETSDALLKNTTRLQQTGRSGLRSETIRFTTIDGKRQPSRVVSRRVLVPAKPRIVARGTANSRAEIAARLNALAENTLVRTDIIAHAAMAMIATAYTAFCDSCSGTGRGATGIAVRQGVVAVDPRVIPLGSHLFIPGYGHAIAGDTGGAIVGRRIDLAFNSNGEAMRFGRRPVTVYLEHTK